MLRARKFLIGLVLLALALLPASRALAWKVSAAGGCRRPDSHPDAYGFFREIIRIPGWRANYYRRYLGVQESQYKRWQKGGQEHRWIDRSDIHYHVSHGGTRWDWTYWRFLKAVVFENGDSLVPGEAYMSWGDQNLEWIGFRCCQLLNDASWRYWARSMNRLHLILGFKTNSYKHNSFGSIWARYMRARRKLVWPGVIRVIPGRTITQAWFIATDLTQPKKRVTARVVAEDWRCYRDHLWGQGFVSVPDPTPDSRRYRWDHRSGSPDFLFVNDLEYLRIYEVVPRDVDEAYVTGIGEAFTFDPCDGVIDLEDSYVMVRGHDANDPEDPNGHILEVFKNSGMFYYHNVGRLWQFDENTTEFYSNPNSIAEARLMSYPQIDPCDKGSGDVDYEYVYGEDANDPCYVPGPGDIYPQSSCVVYAREVEAGGGPHPYATVSVAGPGARMKVYVDEDGQIIGAMGNWRQIQQTGFVQVQDATLALAHLNTYKDKISVAPIIAELKYDSVSADPCAATLAYYEYSALDIQSRLIPVWIFDAEYFKDTNSIAQAYAYVPVATTFYPPITQITSPGDACSVSEGSTIQFECSDPCFGTSPYTYEWASDADGMLSTQSNFDSNALSVSCLGEGQECEVAPHTISLTVTDAHGLQSVEEIQLTIEGDCSGCGDAADLNGDGVVDVGDFAIFASCWLDESAQVERDARSLE